MFTGLVLASVNLCTEPRALLPRPCGPWNQGDKIISPSPHHGHIKDITVFKWPPRFLLPIRACLRYGISFLQLL